MHRFYLKGSNGRVGASWMTKEARDIDIEDNINWLNNLDKEISSKYDIKERILIGFSQGGATAIRWKLKSVNSFNKTIIWASDFPPDMEPQINRLQNENDNYFAIGNEDEYFNEEHQNKLISLYKSANFKISTYLGPHEIDIDVLLRLLKD